MECKVKLIDENTKLCTISMDEMSLKVNLAYDSSKDEVIGLQDFGDAKKPKELATSALVLMARGVMGNWKQSLGYYLVNESCDSDKVREKLFEAIDKATSIGLTVTAVISDLGSNFIKLARDLNITPEKPWFIHNGKKVIYIFDPPHVIKAEGNNMMNYEFHFDKKVASWKDVEALYANDKAQSIRCCPKLTDNHIHPNGFKKIKVKLATQVLSHTVAAGIMMSVSIGTLSASASGTADLIANCKPDQIFDCLNSSTLKDGKFLRRPITSISQHVQFMKEMLTFIASR